MAHRVKRRRQGIESGWETYIILCNVPDAFFVERDFTDGGSRKCRIPDSRVLISVVNNSIYKLMFRFYFIHSVNIHVRGAYNTVADYIGSSSYAILKWQDKCSQFVA